MKGTIHAGVYAHLVNLTFLLNAIFGFLPFCCIFGLCYKYTLGAQSVSGVFYEEKNNLHSFQMNKRDDIIDLRKRKHIKTSLEHVLHSGLKGFKS